MRLSQFIIRNSENILVDFEAFARSMVPEDSMDIAALRDHAEGMLAVIARDLETTQTTGERADKSRGRRDSDEETPDTPAQEHGTGRAESGFTVAQMVSEYRALRASVIRLWGEAKGQLDSADLEDLVRFDESIDQALAESTTRFMEELDSTRETFLGILAHDLRTPLGAIITSGKFMLDAGELPERSRTLAEIVVSSGVRMNDMVDDLLDFTRTRLGLSIPIVRKRLDLEQVITDSVEEIRASRPDADVSVQTSGNLWGEWDRSRLSQVFTNLISNAITHGSAGTPVAVAATGNSSHVVISVSNQGPPIPPDQLQRIFSPLSRNETASHDPSHLGLGLYIAEQIVTGHSGTIEVESSAAHGTTLRVRLPRRASDQPSARTG